MKISPGLCCLLLFACGDDEDTSTDAALPLIDAALPDAGVDAGPSAVTVQFEAVVGQAPFACGSTYRGVGSDASTVTPVDFRFYVHDLALVTADGTQVPVTLDQDGAWQTGNVGLLDFEDHSEACVDGTAETNTALRGSVPPGTYTGVAFSLGVPAPANHTEVSAAPSPLNLSSLYWSWAIGRVFAAVVARVEVTEPVSENIDTYVHIGSTGCTPDPAMGEAVTCTKPNRTRYVIDGFDAGADVLLADWGAILAGTDLDAKVSCHSFPSDACPAAFAALGVDFVTGQPMGTQGFLRVKE